MFKRLSISLLLMGLAVFSLGAAAFAWFSDSESASVSITAGDANIAIDVQIDCTGEPVDTIDKDGTGDEVSSFDFDWGPVAPGDVTEDCFVVHNTGDVPLDIYVKHSAISGLLQNVLQWTYKDDSDNPICGPTLPDANVYDTGDGCELGEVDPGETLSFSAHVEFPDSGDQNQYQNKSLGMTSTVTGYSSS